MKGIYAIKNKITNQYYIGQTLNLKIRKSGHFCALRKNKHQNSHLQNSFNKHGELNFEWLILEEISNNEDLTKQEQYWHDYFKNIATVYNQREFTDSNKGVKCSEQKRAKLIKAHRNEDGSTKTLEQKHGKEKALEIKNRIGESLKGRKKTFIPRSEESKKKTSETMKNKKYTPSKKAHETLSKQRKGKTYEEIYGKERAMELKNRLSKIHTKNNEVK